MALSDDHRLQREEAEDADQQRKPELGATQADQPAEHAHDHAGREASLQRPGHKLPGGAGDRGARVAASLTRGIVSYDLVPGPIPPWR